jgi:hypothetical protein
VMVQCLSARRDASSTCCSYGRSTRFSRERMAAAVAHLQRLTWRSIPVIYRRALVDEKRVPRNIPPSNFVLARQSSSARRSVSEPRLGFEPRKGQGPRPAENQQWQIPHINPPSSGPVAACAIMKRW